MRSVLGAALVILCLAGGPAAADRIVLRGDMVKLRLADGPMLAGEVTLPDGGTAPLADHLGERLTVLNFWATWCAPCRHEMPTLEALAAEPPKGVAVIALSTGRDPAEAIAGFRAEEGIEALTDLRDPSGALGRDAGVRGLPTTLILGPDGAEVARLAGIADWNSADARGALTSIADGQSSP